MKKTVIFIITSFCAITLLAQNKLPHSVNYKSHNHVLPEKPVSSYLEYDMIFEESNVSGGRFGWTVSSAGDFNGDGIDDVAVGADMYDNSSGYVGLFFGGDNTSWICRAVKQN